MIGTLMALVVGFATMVGGILFASFLFSLPVMLLWDAVVPTIFTSMKEITWLQAWGLSVLCSLLFKSTPAKS